MEIKVGDKVRVSKDAQEIFVYGLNPLWFTEESTVVGTHPDGLVIKLDANNHLTTGLAIPTKYLTKVDAEAKEAKFKVGDWVKIGETPNPQLNGRVGAITQIDKEGYKISFNDGFFTVVSEEDLTLADQSTEQTEAEKSDTDNIVDDFAKVMEGYRKVFADIADSFDWQRYEADLTKEIAVKLSKPNENKPGYVADYAVSVAKAVVENLKKK